MKCEELAAIMERSKASPSLGYAFTHYRQDVEALLAWTHDLECKAEILHDQLKAANLQLSEETALRETVGDSLCNALKELDEKDRLVDEVKKMVALSKETRERPHADICGCWACTIDRLFAEKRKCICPNGTRTAIAHVNGCPLED